jgi:predicted DNA-binding transcriptional regulator AlpA
MPTADTPIVLWKASDFRQVMKEVALETFAELLAKQAQPTSPVGALNATQTAKFLGYKETRFYKLLKEHPELDAMAVTVTKRKDGKEIRRWPKDALNAWMQRQSQADLGGSLDGVA